MTVPVLMLQTLAVERGAAGSAPEQEAARAGITSRPGEVAGALEAEHGIENVERNHRNAMRAVRRGCGDPRRHGTGFTDALLQNLPVFVFLVEHQLIGVLGCVELPDRGPDAQLPEHALHAECARLVRDDRHNVLADILVFHQDIQKAYKNHSGGSLASFACGFQQGIEC